MSKAHNLALLFIDDDEVEGTERDPYAVLESTNIGNANPPVAPNISDVPSAKTSRPTTDAHNPGTSDTADESVINLLTNVPRIEAPSGFEGGIGKSNSFIKNPS